MKTSSDWIGSCCQNGAVTLYFRPEVLAEDIEWLKRHDYRVDIFDCSAWIDEAKMHEALRCGLEFPDYVAFGNGLGRNCRHGPQPFQILSVDE